jgi:hypothetical protein
MCVKKRRHMEIDTAGSRLGFRTFQRFFERTTRSKTLKSTEEFINSPYYTEFVKFGHHLAALKPVHADKYIDFVIMAGLKLKDWTKDEVYDLYIIDLLKKEPAVGAVERSISEMADWATTNGTEFINFFKDVNSNEAAYMIKTGRISPWVLYLAASGDALMTRFNEDHAKIIGEIIDPGFWSKKFRNNEDDVDFIRNILDQSGL